MKKEHMSNVVEWINTTSINAWQTSYLPNGTHPTAKPLDGCDVVCPFLSFAHPSYASEELVLQRGSHVHVPCSVPHPVELAHSEFGSL